MIYSDIRVYCDEKGGAIGWDYRRCYVSFKPIGLTIPQMVEKCRLRSLILFYPKSMAEIQFIGSDMGKKVVFFGKEIPTQFKESGQGELYQSSKSPPNFFASFSALVELKLPTIIIDF